MYEWDIKQERTSDTFYHKKRTELEQEVKFRGIKIFTHPEDSKELLSELRRLYINWKDSHTKDIVIL